MDSSDQRRYGDRRNDSTGALNLRRFYSRRRQVRRVMDDTAPARLDVYPPRYFWISVLILLLCMADAVNTLHLLDLGAVELNPLLGALLDRNLTLFALCKHLLTGVGVVILVAYSRHRLFDRLATSQILHGVLLGYLVLVIFQWQVILLYGAP